MAHTTVMAMHLVEHYWEKRLNLSGTVSALVNITNMKYGTYFGKLKKQTNWVNLKKLFVSALQMVNIFIFGQLEMCVYWISTVPWACVNHKCICDTQNQNHSKLCSQNLSSFFLNTKTLVKDELHFFAKLARWRTVLNMNTFTDILQEFSIDF